MASNNNNDGGGGARRDTDDSFRLGTVFLDGAQLTHGSSGQRRTSTYNDLPGWTEFDSSEDPSSAATSSSDDDDTVDIEYMNEASEGGGPAYRTHSVGTGWQGTTAAFRMFNEAPDPLASIRPGFGAGSSLIVDHAQRHTGNQPASRRHLEGANTKERRKKRESFMSSMVKRLSFTKSNRPADMDDISLHDAVTACDDFVASGSQKGSSGTLVAMAIVLACATLSLVVAGIEVGVFARGGLFGGGSGGGGSVRSEVASPTMAPNTAPPATHLVHIEPPQTGDEEFRIEVLRHRLVDAGVNVHSEFSDLTSIRFYALRWLSDTDAARISVDDEFLVHRYVMAVFFYSHHPEIANAHSNGEWWKVSSTQGSEFEKWMTSEDICNWNGIECEDRSPISIILPKAGMQGTLPKELRALTDLLRLDLSNNQIGGSIPCLYGLSELVDLRLDHNNLVGKVPELSNHVNLEVVSLQMNSLTGIMPHNLDALVGLKTLDVSYNNLHGTIPPHIENLFRLTALKLQNNHFSGRLPKLANVPRMKYLQLGRNELTGTLPKEWASLYQLEYLVLNHNKLTGKIPRVYGDLSSLEFLWLNDNQLSDSLPTELGQLKELKSLFVENNELVGELPSEIGELPELASIRAHGNQITGTVPQEICNIRESHLQVLSTDCDEKVECDCCDECH